MRFMPTAFVLAAFASGAVFADCVAPTNQVSIPNGAEATREQMLAAKKDLNAYNDAVKVYSDCLNQEMDAKVAEGGDKKVLQPVYDKRADEAIDKLKAAAAKFNAELLIFKAKNPS